MSGDAKPKVIPEPGPRPDFEIGLALAGAISAGAYTAGVIDFLMQALAAWEAERGKDAPDHTVKIRTIAGASAGAITGALGIVAMARGLRPVPLTDAERATAQIGPGATLQGVRCVLPSLYDTWVKRPCMVAKAGSGARDLLGDDDVVRRGADGKIVKPRADDPIVVRSLLNAALLDEIERAALQYPAAPSGGRAEGDPGEAGPKAAAAPFPFLSADLHVFMTVTNLRGIPFEVAFGQTHYGMLTHGDRLHYKVTGLGTEEKSQDGKTALGRWEECGWLRSDKHLPLHTDTLPRTEGGAVPGAWLAYGDCAIASAAFPLGLAPRPIETPFDQYKDRQYPFPTAIGKVNAKFPDTVDLSTSYRFLSVDGGVVNNSPFDFVEFSLWSRSEARKTGADSDRAVIMVAPFPEPPTFLGDGQPRAELVSVVRALFPALINQARFRSAELGPAVDPDDRSRFLISPSRSFKDGPLERYPIACGLLGGFGGFLDEQFRAHDFQLGRRNCQRFLASVFGLPKTSDAFHPETGARQIGLAARGGDAYDAAGRDFMIVPLVGKAAHEVGLPPWPRMSGEAFQELMQRIEGRFDAIKGPLVAGQIGKTELRIVAGTLLLLSRSRILQFVEATILADLVRRNQIAGWDLPEEVVAITDQSKPGRTTDDVRLILASLVGPAQREATDDQIIKATHLDRYFVAEVLKRLGRLPDGVPHRVIRKGSLYTLQMHVPTGAQAWPLIGRWIERFWPQRYRYG